MAAKSVSLNMIESGTWGSDTLVFLPGLSGTTHYWLGRLGRLEDKYRILLVDPLGFGDSPKPWSRYTVDHHVDALYQTLKNEKRFVLVGHSMGTLLSIAYAARHPEQVKSLVLMSTPFFGNAREARRFFSSQPIPMGWFFSNMALAALICIITRRVFGRFIPYFLHSIPRDIAADIVKHSWRSFTSSFWEVICNYEVKRDADALGDLPVLCIHGKQDETAPLCGVQLLAEGRPTWQVNILPGVDHHPLLRRPTTCIEEIELAIARSTSELDKPPAHILAIEMNVEIAPHPSLPFSTTLLEKEVQDA